MEENKSKKRGFFERIFKKDDERVAEDRPPAEQQKEDLEAMDPSVAESKELAESDWEAGSAEELNREQSVSSLRTGLTKTRSGFVRNLDELFLGKKELDEEMIGRLEEILVTADIGVQTAYHLLDSVTARMKRKELSHAGLILAHLKAEIEELLLKVESPLRVGFPPEPFVVMVVGVNGSGKTTTIAKIAARHKAAGAKVLMVAGDTFRAAAVEQMEIWADRVGCPVVKGKEKADPSSVAFMGMERALAEGSDLVLIDTAGRLHTRVPLMEQLKKLSRTLDKKLPGAPHETLLVIDASNGQNAILQAKTFHEAVPVTGIALTKLDGTSKGGVLVGISNELNIPVRYIGIGEKMDDLRDFNARDFAEALFADTVLAGER